MSLSSKTAAPARTERKRDRTRGELVAAAEKLVAARGIDAISIDDITEAADVAKGTFYTHFADKTDLAAAIAERVRLDLEDKITRTNQGVSDASERMANGISNVLAFALANPVRARAMLRLQPGVVDPDAPINAGIKGDIALGVKTKRFTVPSLQAGVVAAISIAMGAIARLADDVRRPANPYEFATEIVTIVLVALGVKPSEAARAAAAAVQARKKES